MTIYVVNQTDYQKNVPLEDVNTSAKSSVFIQPHSRIKLPPDRKVENEFLTLNPRVRVIDSEPKEQPSEDAPKSPSSGTKK